MAKICRVHTGLTLVLHGVIRAHIDIAFSLRSRLRHHVEVCDHRQEPYYLPFSLLFTIYDPSSASV